MNQLDISADSTQGTPLPTRPRAKLWRIGLTIAVVAVVAYFLGKSIISQWDVVRAQPWKIHVGWLLASALVSWLGVIWLMYLWRVVIVFLSGRPLRFWVAYRIAALANLGKYLPGKVWSVMGLIYFLTKEGHPGPAAIAATVLHQAYTLVSGILFVSVVLGVGVWGRVPVAVVMGALAIALTILYPPIFERLLNWGLRIIKREPVILRISFLHAVLLYVGYTAAWVVYGSGFWLMSKGLGIPAGTFWPVVASYGGAYLVGFLALFAPGGLGVREGVLAVMLGPFLPPGLPATVAVLSRLWMTVIELLGLLPLLLVGKSQEFK